MMDPSGHHGTAVSAPSEGHTRPSVDGTSARHSYGDVQPMMVIHHGAMPQPLTIPPYSYGAPTSHGGHQHLAEGFPAYVTPASPGISPTHAAGYSHHVMPSAPVHYVYQTPQLPVHQPLLHEHLNAPHSAHMPATGGTKPFAAGKRRGSAFSAAGQNQAAGQRRHSESQIGQGGAGKFKTKVCIFYLTPEGCPYGDKCFFAHGIGDLRADSSGSCPGSSPATNRRYKTRMCVHWVQSQGKYCPHGVRCAFAHGSDELAAYRSLYTETDQETITSIDPVTSLAIAIAHSRQSQEQPGTSSDAVLIPSSRRARRRRGLSDGPLYQRSQYQNNLAAGAAAAAMAMAEAPMAAQARRRAQSGPPLPPSKPAMMSKELHHRMMQPPRSGLVSLAEMGEEGKAEEDYMDGIMKSLEHQHLGFAESPLASPISLDGSSPHSPGTIGQHSTDLHLSMGHVSTAGSSPTHSRVSSDESAWMSRDVHSTSPPAPGWSPFMASYASMPLSGSYNSQSDSLLLAHSPTPGFSVTSTDSSGGSQA